MGLLIQCQRYIHSASYGATYHWVVTNTEEAHHLNVCRNRSVVYIGKDAMG